MLQVLIKRCDKLPIMRMLKNKYKYLPLCFEGTIPVKKILKLTIKNPNEKATTIRCMSTKAKDSLNCSHTLVITMQTIFIITSFLKFHLSIDSPPNKIPNAPATYELKLKICEYILGTPFVNNKF